MALPVGPTIPVPTAYFPLTNDSLHSWPIPQYWAYNASAVKAKQTRFVHDDYFGTVVQCNASAGRPWDPRTRNPESMEKPENLKILFIQPSGRQSSLGHSGSLCRCAGVPFGARCMSS